MECLPIKTNSIFGCSYDRNKKEKEFEFKLNNIESRQKKLEEENLRKEEKIKEQEKENEKLKEKYEKYKEEK